MWDHILTDEDGPYIELMTGGYSDNQPDYSWIQPGESRTVVHYWYPVRELGGIKAATLEGALNLEVKDGRARVAANTTTARPGAKVTLAGQGRVLFETTATIAPDAPFVREMPLPASVRAKSLHLAVRAADGKELVAYESSPHPTTPEPTRYAPSPAPTKMDTVEELYLAKQHLEQFHNPHLEPEFSTARFCAARVTRARTRRSGCSFIVAAGSRRPRSGSFSPSTDRSQIIFAREVGRCSTR
jgi:hypothetical protein